MIRKMRSNLNNNLGKDFITGSVSKNLITFTPPILIGSNLSTGYSAINTMWVGKLIAKDAVSTVAVSFTIFLGMVVLCSDAINK